MIRRSRCGRQFRQPHGGSRIRCRRGSGTGSRSPVLHRRGRCRDRVAITAARTSVPTGRGGLGPGEDRGEAGAGLAGCSRSGAHRGGGLLLCRRAHPDPLHGRSSRDRIGERLARATTGKVRLPWWGRIRRSNSRGRQGGRRQERQPWTGSGRSGIHHGSRCNEGRTSRGGTSGRRTGGRRTGGRRTSRCGISRADHVGRRDRRCFRDRQGYGRLGNRACTRGHHQRFRATGRRFHRRAHLEGSSPPGLDPTPAVCQ